MSPMRPLTEGGVERSRRASGARRRTTRGARLATSACESVLGPESSLLVEGASPLRYRLTRGVLELDGACTVSTEWGVLDLAPGDVRMEVGPEGMTVDCRAGEVTLTGASGVTHIPAGTISRFERGAAPGNEPR